MKHIFGKKTSQSGFSLVELMIVVGIIGVLSTLALPRFKQFQAKAKAAEGIAMLAHIYTLEQAYQLDNNIFVAFQAMGASTNASNGSTCNNPGAVTLGFTIDPCPPNGPIPRFQYRADVPTTDVFTAFATTGAGANNRICPGNAAFSQTLTHLNVSGFVPANGSVAAACRS